MRKSLPETMFTNAEQSRLTMLRNWVLDNEVTQIAMKERQFWNLAALQRVDDFRKRSAITVKMVARLSRQSEAKTERARGNTGNYAFAGCCLKLITSSTLCWTGSSAQLTIFS